MLLENENCIIEIEADGTYTVDSADNRYYDVILNPFNYTHGDLTKTFAISIDLFSKRFTAALIGPCLACDSDCAVLDNNILTVLMDTAIIRININDGSVIYHTELDCLGCNLAIYRIDKGYIVYGETEITMLDPDFEKKWSFSGEDIFASVSGKVPFEITENSIRLYDFEDNFYEIDFDGNRIK